MADDDRRDDDDALFGGEDGEHRRAGEMREGSEDLDELTERVSERLEEGERAAEQARAEAEPGDESAGRPRIFSKDQLVEEAGVMARKMYGENRFSLETETYGQRISDAGYYDLVDCWLVIAHRMDIKYHERFLKRASALPWGSRFNRRAIPNYYLFSMQGIDEAIAEHYISPLVSHKYKYLFTVKWLLPFGPPLAYFDAFGLSHQEAIAHAQLFEEGHGEQFRGKEQQELTYLKYEIDRAEKRFRQHKKDAQEMKKKYDETGDNVWKRRMEAELADAKEEYQQMHQMYQEYKEEKRERES